MKSNKSVILLFYIALNTLLISSTALSQKPTQTIYPLKDAFVGRMWPNSNSGDFHWLTICEGHPSNDIYISFIYFELPLGYEDYDGIYFHFTVYLDWIDSIFYANFYRVTQSWDEFTITWNNMPTIGEFLFSTQLTNHGKIFDINVTEYVTSYIFSFCITGSFPQDTMAQITSRDDEGEEPPVIILMDEQPQQQSNNLPIFIGTVVGVIAAVGVSGGLGYFYYRRKRSLPKISQQTSQQITDKEPIKVTDNIKSCIACGHKNPKSALFCNACGKKLPI